MSLAPTGANRFRPDKVWTVGHSCVLHSDDGQSLTRAAYVNRRRFSASIWVQALGWGLAVELLARTGKPALSLRPSLGQEEFSR